MGPASVRVASYDYSIDLETHAATTALSLHLLTEGDCLSLPSRATQLDLGSVMLGGTAATATSDGFTLTACGAGWIAGTDLILTANLSLPVGTWAPSQVGYSVTNDGTQQPLFYLLSWVGNCDRFGPCDPAPSVFAHYKFTVHHRSGVQALCPGHVTPGDLITTCEFDYGGGPTYSTFGVIASPSWVTTELGTWSGVKATLYDRAGTGMAALVDRPYHQAFVAWMVARFGAFPFGDELRIATGPTYWSGFEHPGNIVLDDALARPFGQSYARPVSHVLNHEIAHQWAGDQTTLADTYDFVWKESMAEYLSFVYEDETEPAVALVTARAWKAFAMGARYFPVPQDAMRPTLLQYYGEVYGPGPMILFRQLEALTSRPQVIDALKQLLGTPRAIGVADVQTALEATTGLNLSTYFATWIRGSGAPVWPTFRVAVTGTAPTQQLVVTETTPGGTLHGCNFSIGMTGAGAGETDKRWIDRGVNGMAAVTVPTGVTWPVTATSLDPDAQCLAYPSTTATAPARHPDGWTPWTTRSLSPANR
jgi:aminopeptidase N